MALSLQAHALSLGRLQVLSAMGEPMRAEVTLQDFNPAEAAGLQLKALPATAYSALGQQNNALASDFEITLLQSADGAKLLLSSRRVIDAAFVDFVLEARWPAGRSVREYTALFDEKASTPQASAQALVKPQVEAAPSGTDNNTAAPALSTAKAREQKTESKKSDSTSATGTRANADWVVQRGQTAATIAQRTIAANQAEVTLDQMLLALVRDNPDAFVDNNVNRLRTGSALRLPDTASAQQTAAPEARELIALQYKDFVAWRERLAQATPRRDQPEADRQHSGTVKQAAAPETSGDKLTLSKPAVDTRSAEQVAKDLQTRDLQTSNRELASKLDALDQLGAKARSTADKVAAADASNNAAASASPQPAAPTDTADAETSDADKNKTQRGDKPEDKSAESSGVLPAPPLAAQDAPETPALLERLIASPFMPAAAGGLIAVMAALALWRVRQRRKNESVAPAQTPESQTLQPLNVDAALDATLDTNSDRTEDVDVVSAVVTDAAPWQPPQPSEDEAQHSAGTPLSPAEIMSRLPDLDLPRLDNAEDPPAHLDIPEPVNAQDLTPDDPPVVIDTQIDTQPEDEPAATPTAHQPLALDLDGLSLDLDVPLTSSELSPDPSADAPSLASKLDLAREFAAMGDKEGARALVDEIMAQGDADLRTAAQALLPELS